MERGGRFGVLALLAMAIAGCAGPAPPSPVPAEGPAKPEVETLIKVVVVDDIPLAEAIRREWKARSKAPLEVVEAKWDSSLPAAAPPGDAIIYPVGMLGELAEKRWIASFPDTALEEVNRQRPDLSRLALQGECSWGGSIWAVPLGSRGFVLYARADVLHDNGSSLPATWEEYAATVRRLRSSEWAKDPQHVIAVEPLADGAGGMMLLARAAPYLRHRGNYSTYFDFSSMEPLLTSPPMVKALEEMVASADLKGAAAKPLSSIACLDLFWKGHAALAIGSPGQGVARREGTIPPEQVTIADLPGATQVFNPSDQRWEKRGADEPTRIPLAGVSGRIGSLLAASPNKIAAANRLMFLIGPEWSPAISPASAATGPFRRSQLKQLKPWQETEIDARLSHELADVLTARFDAPLSMSPPYFPGRTRYLAALDEAVQSAMSGKVKPADALAKAAATWSAITKELGFPAQKGAFRRLLGLKE